MAHVEPPRGRKDRFACSLDPAMGVLSSRLRGRRSPRSREVVESSLRGLSDVNWLLLFVCPGRDALADSGASHTRRFPLSHRPPPARRQPRREVATRGGPGVQAGLSATSDNIGGRRMPGRTASAFRFSPAEHGQIGPAEHRVGRPFLRPATGQNAPSNRWGRGDRARWQVRESRRRVPRSRRRRESDEGDRDGSHRRHAARFPEPARSARCRPRDSG